MRMPPPDRSSCSLRNGDRNLRQHGNDARHLIAVVCAQQKKSPGEGLLGRDSGAPFRDIFGEPKETVNGGSEGNFTSINHTRTFR
jgi:hypothetical protein